MLIEPRFTDAYQQHLVDFYQWIIHVYQSCVQQSERPRTFADWIIENDVRACVQSANVREHSLCWTQHWCAFRNGLRRLDISSFLCFLSVTFSAILRCVRFKGHMNSGIVYQCNLCHKQSTNWFKRKLCLNEIEFWICCLRPS